MARIADSDRPEIDFDALPEPEVVVAFRRSSALTLEDINPRVAGMVERAYLLTVNKTDKESGKVLVLPLPDVAVAKEIRRLALAYGKLREGGEITVGAAITEDVAGKKVTLTISARPKIRHAEHASPGKAQK